MSRLDTINNLTSHIETQLEAITNVNEFVTGDPSRDISDNLDWVAFMYQYRWGLSPHYSIAGVNTPNYRIVKRIGIVVTDTKRDEHESAVIEASVALFNWFWSWYQNKTYKTVSNAINVEATNILTQSQRLPTMTGLRTAVFMEIPFDIGDE